jgi:putative ABC transport system ATP-binding protein
MSLISIRQVSKSYTVGKQTVNALKPLDLEIQKGEYLAIFGVSGSGKSTLLNILGLLDSPSSGSYYLDGKDVSHLSDSRASSVRNLQVGIIFQSFNLFPQLSVLENVMVPMDYAKVGSREKRRRASELLDRLGMADRMNHKPSELSGGQCQRVAIARSLSNNPPLLLADEPTGNLDEETGNQVLEIFRELAAEGKTVIMVTHNPEYERIVQRVIRLKDGALV